MLRKSLAAALCCLIATSAYADTQTGATIALGPIYSALAPFIPPIIGVLFAALYRLVAKWLHVNDSENARQAIQDAAANAAGRIMAAHDASIATMQVPVGSPIIAAEVPIVEAAVGDAMTKLGMTPDSVANLIAGKLGQLQAQAQSVQVPAPPAEVQK